MHYELFKAENNKKLQNLLQNAPFKTNIAYDEKTSELCINLQDKSELLGFLAYIKRDPNLDFSLLVAICGVDRLYKTPRFQILYHLLSLNHNWRLRLVLETKENEALPSVCSIYPNANWYERESYDMFGIIFDGHPDLRRILTDYAFRGHPLRKDFPVSGDWQLRYDEAAGAIIEEPLRLKEEFRNYDFVSPWSGYNNKDKVENSDILRWRDAPLPGDEKASSGLSSNKN